LRQAIRILWTFIRIIGVRASATSKTASPANYFASQAKADANKADNNSPFALLVASVAPQTPANKDAAKPAAKDASNGEPDDDKASPAQNNRQDGPAANAPADAVAAAIPSQPIKPEKSDKGKIEPSKTGDEPAGQDVVAALAPSQDVTALPQQPQILPPPPLPPQPPVLSADDASDLQIGAAAPAGAQPPAPAGAKPASNPSEIESSGTAPSGAGAEDPAKTGAPEIEPPKPAVTAQAPIFSPVANPAATPSPQHAANEDEDTDNQAAEPAASAPVPVVTDNAVAPNLAKIAAATQGPAIQDAPAGNADDVESDTAQAEHAKSRASAMGIEHAAPRSAAAKASLANPGQDKTTEAAKPGAPKNRVIQTDAGGAGKSETEKSAAAESDSPKLAPQPELQTAANSKAAPQPAPAAIEAVNTIAAPQAQSSPVAAAAPNQHIQVTAHAAPDLPALAVEIAAKSQSGAKQFDIRLDPPELGRVEVRLSIDATGKASAHLSADQPQTLSLLQKDAPILARALRDAGLDVSQNGLNFSLRQQGENPNGNANNNGRRPRSFPLSASLGIDAPTGSVAYRGPANGRLDIRV
jgi:flagellar hook-length control protein FliK